MPNPNITTSYVGESASKYIASSLLSANTIENGGLTVVPNIKFRQTMKIADLDAGIVDATCEYATSGTTTLTERILQPKELQSLQTLCLPEFRKDWDAVSMGYSVHDNLPPSFQEWLIAYVLGKIAAKTEIDIWNGVGTGAGAVNGEFDGLLPQIAAAVVAGEVPAAQVVPLVAGGLNAANIITELGLLVDAVPDSTYSNEGAFIYMGISAYKLYTRSLGGFAANGQGANGFEGRGNNQSFDTGLMFDGMKIFCAHGMPKDKMLVTTVDNLFFGTGLMSDSQECTILDMRPTTGSQEARVIVRYTAGTTYGVGANITTYGI